MSDQVDNQPSIQQILSRIKSIEENLERSKKLSDHSESGNEIAKITKSISDIQFTQSQHETNITALREQAESMNSHLHNELMKFKELLEKLNKMQTQHKEEISELQELIDDHSAQIEDIQSSMKNISQTNNNEISIDQSQISMIKSEIMALKQEVAVKQTSFMKAEESHITESNDTETEIVTTKVIPTTYDPTILRQFQDNQQYFNNELIQIKKRAAQNELNIADNHDIINNLKEFMENSNLKFVKDLQEIASAIEEDQNDIHDHLDHLDEKTKGIQEDIDGITEDIKTIDDDFQYCYKQVKNNEANIHTLQDNLNIIDEDLSQTQEVINNNQALTESLISDLRCLKYELKKLKTTQFDPDAVNSQLSQTNQQIQDLRSYIDNLSQSIEDELSVKSRDLEIIRYQISRFENQNYNTSEIENPATITQIKYNLEKHNTLIQEVLNDTKCLKYEIRKLKHMKSKESSSTSNLSPNLLVEKGELKTQRSDIISVISELENKISSQRNEVSLASSDIRCLKYEIRRLKQKENHIFIKDKYDEGISSNFNNSYEIDHIKELLTNVINDNKCMKYEVRKLKHSHLTSFANKKNFESDNKVENSLNVSKILELQNQNEKINQAIRCIKYEIKQLKKREIPETNETGIPTAVEERAVEIPNFDASEKDELRIHINELEEALRCVKHELRQLKKSSIATAEKDESSSFIFRPLESDVRCLKYEVRRLKQNKEELNNVEKSKIESNLVSSEIEKIKQSISITENKLKETNTHTYLIEKSLQNLEYQFNQLKDFQLQNDKNDQAFRCIKYELKLLKKNINFDSNQDYQRIDSYIREFQEIKEELVKFDRSLRCIKYEIKQKEKLWR